MIRQVKEEYLKGNKHILVVAPCGSGKSVVIGQILRDLETKGNKALFLVHRKELIEQMKRYTQGNEAVDLITVQSMLRRLNDYCKDHYNLIVTDESHHSMAKSYTKIYEYFDKAYRLGFTATPIRLDGRGLGDVYDAIVEAPSVQYMIDNHYLSDFRYFAPVLIDTKKLKKERGEYSNKSIDELLTARVYGDVLAHYKRLAEGKKTIVYTNTINTAENVAKVFIKAGYEAKAIHSKINNKEREEMVNDFKSGKLNILVNVDLFGEGFDVPDCECVILLRPTTSLALHVQQSMRSMRYKEGKTALIIDHVANYMRHGRPTTVHEWSLETTKVKDTEKVLTVKCCPQCGFTYESKYSRCPNCGYEAPKEEAEPLIIDKSVDLQEIKEEDVKNMSDLYKLAKQRGYKKGWAYYQGLQRGWIHSNLPQINIIKRS